MEIFKLFVDKVWLYVGLAFAALGLGVGFLLKVRESGEDRIIRESLERTVEANKKRKEVENEVGMLVDDTVVKQLRKHGALRD